MNKTKCADTDFLYASARVRALENHLVTKERVNRMLEAKTDGDAAKVLSECGYELPQPLTIPGLEAALSAERDKTLGLMRELSPIPELAEFFRIKYDYHNIKALLKEPYTEDKVEPLLMDFGRIPARRMADMIREKDYSSLSPAAKKAAEEARDILARTQDAQLSDMALDSAMYEDMRMFAEAAESEFLLGYITLLIDTANLRAAVRTSRMRGGFEILRRAVITGGNVSETRIIAAGEPSAATIEEIYGSTPLRDAVTAGSMYMRDGGRLTEFEKRCDDTLTAYLRGARRVAFGDAPLISYAAAKENEITLTRTLMSGRMAGLSAEVIRERLRETYV